MTQKELLYIEDAIGHENNIICICEDMLKTIEDKNILSFMNKQIKKHTNMKERLLLVLEEKSNE